MKRLILILLPALAALSLAGCDNSAVSAHAPAPTDGRETARWYSTDMTVRGEALFQAHCATCHQADASGTPDWKELTPEGKYPPPPLNGTAHTWHHPLNALRRTVRLGGIPLGGSMPGFQGKLSDREIDDLLAWIQSHWSDEIYLVWAERDRRSR